MLSLIVVLLILVTLTVLLIGGKKDDMGSAHTDDINDNKYHVTTLEKIAVLSVFRLHASPYERFVLDAIIEELEKEPES